MWMLLSFLVKNKRKTAFFYKLLPFLDKNIRELYFEDGVWVHAVSLGELRASVNFIDILIEKIKKPIYLSVVTRTGYDYAKKYYAKDADHVCIFYFPYDFYFSIKIILNFIKPILFVSIETEIWPNLFNMLKKRKVMISIVNARISDKSYKNYYALNFFFKFVFESIGLVLCISNGYYEKFLMLGVKKENIHITGNMKFDLKLDSLTDEDSKKNIILKNIFKNNRVIVAGSTHKEEEKLILDAFAKLNGKKKKTVLFIAPRHPERFEYVYDLILNSNFQCRRLSAIYSAGDKAEVSLDYGDIGSKLVILVDIIGELMSIYSVCDVAFVGGSMVRVGGHNLLEPLFFGKPVIFGKYVENFSEIADKIINIKAGKMVLSSEELFDSVSFYLYDNNAKEIAKSNGLNLISQNRGSSLKNLEYIIDRANLSAIS